MNQENTCWNRSVTGIVIRDGKVLLVRHTYGPGKGRLIVPGGYILEGELPEDAVKREVFEETQVVVEPEGILGVRFNQKDWYVAFRARYVSGEARSDNDENSEAIWMDAVEAMNHPDVPDLSRKLIGCALSGHINERIHYDGTTKYGPYTFYGVGLE